MKWGKRLNVTETNIYLKTKLHLFLLIPTHCPNIIVLLCAETLITKKVWALA